MRVQGSGFRVVGFRGMIVNFSLTIKSNGVRFMDTLPPLVEGCPAADVSL